jgi:hypothetical protein
MKNKLQFYTLSFLGTIASMYIVFLWSEYVEYGLSGLIFIVTNCLIGLLLAFAYCELLASRIKKYYWAVTVLVSIVLVVPLEQLGVYEIGVFDMIPLTSAFLLTSLSYRDKLVGETVS